MTDISYVRQGHEILTDNGMCDVLDIAEAARTCYLSVPKGETEEEQDAANMALVRSLIRRGHGAMLEHSFLSVRFRTDRAIANELVRHRLLSYAQESTRYVNYGKRGFEFVLPDTRNPFTIEHYRDACEAAVAAYEAMVADGVNPENARGVLPLCTATTIVASGNFREWRHVLSLRTARNAHPMIRALMTPLLDELKETVPVVFDDIEPHRG